MAKSQNLTKDLTPITEQKLIKYKVTKSFEFFIKYFFKKKSGRKFIMNDHHLEIIAALNDVIQGHTKRLIINIAPRYSKTEIAVKMLIAYCLGLNSKAKFIHLSYSDTLALDNSEEIKDMVQSEEFQELFDIEIKKDSKSKKKWYTTDGGGVYATAAGGQVTGFGAGKVEDEDEEFDKMLSDLETAKGFGGAIIIDDPIKPDDADSETAREKINNRFDSTIRSRTNSRNTPIIIVMQRLHPEDLSGYLMDVEPEEWKILSLPAIKEDGSALWHHKHTIEELRHLEQVNESVFKRQYMQNPEPSEGLMFDKAEINYFTEDQLDRKNIESSISFADIADKGKDYHSAPYGKMVGNRIFIDDVIFTQDGTDVNVSMTVIKTNEHLPEYMQIESNFGGGMYIQLMGANQEPSMNGVTALIAMNAKANKHTRIQTMAGFIKKYFYFREDFDETTPYGQFMVNLTKYTKTGKGVKHDDAPDSIAGLARMVLMYYSDLFEGEYSAQVEE